MNKKQALAATGAAAVSFLMAVPALAATGVVSTPRNPSHASSSISTDRRDRSEKLSLAAFGIITSINGATLQLSERTPAHASSTVSVTTTSATVYKKNGVAESSTDLAVGQRVVVMGTKDSAGNITNATSINVMVPRTVHTSANWRNK